MTVSTVPLRSVVRTKVLIFLAVLLNLNLAIPSRAVSPVRVGTSAHVDHVELEVREATGNLFGIVRHMIPSAEIFAAIGHRMAVRLGIGGRWQRISMMA